MNDIVITDPSHRLHSELLKFNPIEIHELEKKDLKQKKIYDFTLTRKKEKEDLFNQLLEANVSEVYSDFSCSQFFQHQLNPYPFSLAFYSPNNTYECIHSSPLKDSFFSHYGFKFIEVKTAKSFFYFPRTIATIINEAYYALNDSVAEIQDIDLAMKYGVNYPLGPFEWEEKIGPKAIVLLLDELYETTKDERYLAAPNLRKNS